MNAPLNSVMSRARRKLIQFPQEIREFVLKCRIRLTTPQSKNNFKIPVFQEIKKPKPLKIVHYNFLPRTSIKDK